MITERDLMEAITECQGVRNPNANTCVKLASYYTILDHMSNKSAGPVEYSFDPGPPNLPKRLGDSEFLGSIQEKNIDGVLTVIDELMSTLQIVSPRLYRGVMHKLKEVE